MDAADVAETDAPVASARGGEHPTRERGERSAELEGGRRAERRRAGLGGGDGGGDESAEVDVPLDAAGRVLRAEGAKDLLGGGAKVVREGEAESEADGRGGGFESEARDARSTPVVDLGGGGG